MKIKLNSLLYSKCDNYLYKWIKICYIISVLKVYQDFLENFNIFSSKINKNIWFVFSIIFEKLFIKYFKINDNFLQNQSFFRFDLSRIGSRNNLIVIYLVN